MMRLISLATSVLLATAPVWAEPYWYAYEGNDFPENEGWERYATDPPAERWLEDGSFFIDSRDGVHTVDNYTIYFDEGGLDPEPGETFIMSWRLNVHEAVPNREDPGVYVISDDLWSVAFLFDEDSLQSFYEPTVDVELEPHVYHEFELRSGDMRSYELYVDGELAIEGVFFEGFFSPYVGFGDITGGRSLAAWDYFRFGVVPEPCSLLMLVGLCIGAGRTRRCAARAASAVDGRVAAIDGSTSCD
jgi:hypothetical protein